MSQLGAEAGQGPQRCYVPQEPQIHQSEIKRKAPPLIRTFSCLIAMRRQRLSGWTGQIRTFPWSQKWPQGGAALDPKTLQDLFTPSTKIWGSYVPRSQSIEHLGIGSIGHDQLFFSLMKRKKIENTTGHQVPKKQG